MKTRLLASALLFAVSVAAPACSDKKGSSSSESKSEKGAAAKPQRGTKPIAVEVFGKKPAPFGPLTKLTLKQSGDDARKAAPELFSKPDSSGEIVASPEYAELSFATSIDKKTNKLDRIYAQIPKSAVPLVSQAWGKGIDAKDSIGRARTVWFDPDTGWRVSLEEGFGESLNLNFDRYLPAAKLLGPEKGDKLGFAPDGLL
ncbi:MAG TPA: hypothetical protein VGM39_05870, partial [Kofleriaceae bacterium]